LFQKFKAKNTLNKANLSITEKEPPSSHVSVKRSRKRMIINKSQKDETL